MSANFILIGSRYNDSNSVKASEERLERIKIIHRAIAKLWPEQQRLIYDVYFRKILATEIARREGVNKLAVSHRLKRALKTPQRHFAV